MINLYEKLLSQCLEMKGTGFIVYRKEEFIDLTNLNSPEKIESLINEIE